MLEVSGLHAGYGALRILRGIDMKIGGGEIVAVLGSNGVGKTTLNNTLTGLLRPTAGSITWLGESIAGAAPQRIVASGLVQVPEGRRIFPNLTVRENLELGSYRRARANRSRNMERILGWFPRLRERLAQLAGTLSGGEHGRAEAADSRRALARPVAAHGRRDVRHDPAHQPRGRDRAAG